MKKNIIYCIILVVLVACSPRKDGFTNRNAQKFKSYYNTLFNSKEALETEIKNRKLSFVEDYYQDYIPLVPFEAKMLAQNKDLSSDTEANLNFIGDFAKKTEATELGAKGATILEIAEAKALKTISEHSMYFNGVEKNKYIFDAYLFLAKSRIYQEKHLEAIDALQQLKNVFKSDKRLPLAKIYEALAYFKLGDFYKSNEIFLELKNQPKLKKKYRALASVYYSELLLKNDHKQQAVEELETAYDLNKNNFLRSRIAFLRGQILANLNRKEDAIASFVTAYKNTKDFEFEVKSQIEIAKLTQGEEENYQNAKSHLEKLLKKGTYLSRKNELEYALGKLALEFKKEDEAQAYFQKSVKEKISDGQIRGLAYYELGKKHFDKDDYISAGNYYDSALIAMKHLPTKSRLEDLNKNIKKLAVNYYLVKKNDSLLSLIKMPENEKTKFFDKIISDLKKKEAIEEAVAKKEKRSKGFDTGDYNSKNATGFASTNFSENLIGKGKFYFANQNTVANGLSDFKKTWGERNLIDNWRSQTKTNNVQDQKNVAMGRSTAPNPRRFETQYYIEQLPNDPKLITQLKLDRDTASLGMGIMYHQLFNNTDLATKTFFKLVDNQPISDVKLQALYQIFYINFETNPEKANRAKTAILTEFPYTAYAEFVRNPKNTSKKVFNANTEKIYSNAYQLYADGQYSESKTLIQNTITAVPNDALVPKMSLLDVFNTAKIAGKEVMILQLEQIVLNYPKTPEGIKAKKMLRNLKSDLKLDLSDDQGNRIDTGQKQPEQPSAEQAEKRMKERMEKEEIERQENLKQVEDEPQGPSLFPEQNKPPIISQEKPKIQ